MLDKNSKICTVLKTQAEVEFVNVALAEHGYRRITAFTSAKEAYEVAIRQQFDIFIMRMEMPDMPGVVLIQKLRDTGNYGHEVHLFVTDRVTTEIYNILYEFDISYVLTAPINKRAVIDKFTHLLKSENELSDFEKSYRQARSALFNKIVEMADDMAQKLNQERPKNEKVLLLLGDIAAAKETGAEDMFRYYSEALAANPKSAIANHKLAAAMMRLGRHREAATLLEAQAKLNPYNIKLLENAGLSNFEIKEYAKAEAFAGKVAQLDQGNKSAGELTARSKIARGDFSGLTDALRGSHDDKEIVSFLNNAGVKLAQGNDVPGALKMYQSCLAQLEGSKYLHAVYFNMGLAYRRLNEPENAIKAFERAVKLSPDFEKAKAAIADLKAKLTKAS